MSKIILKCFFVGWLQLNTSVMADVQHLEGDWQLQITGEDNLEFGSQFLAAGVTVKWRTEILFSIADGLLVNATGKSSLEPNVKAYSRPENVFSCQKIDGSYVTKSGQFFITPHLRYERFPVTGEVISSAQTMDQIRLQHGMEYPGNYYGLLFQCQTEKKEGKIWLEQSPRVSKERGSRQSIDIVQTGADYRVKIKQVKEIQPGPEVIIPLLAGWEMTFTDAFSSTKIRYKLERK